MSPRDLLNRLHDEPFVPFRVRLSNNTTLDITNPGLVIVGPTSAVMPIRTAKDDFGYTLVTQWRTIALSHIIEFSDIDTPKSGRKRPAWTRSLSRSLCREIAWHSRAVAPPPAAAILLAHAVRGPPALARVRAARGRAVASVGGARGR